MVLRGLTIADDPATWTALGFDVRQDSVVLGGIEITLAGRAAGAGILAWSVDGLPGGSLPAHPSRGTVPREGWGQPNGVCGVDHVVVVAGDFDAAVARLADDGLHARRVRAVPGGETRQAFYVLGTALLELAGPAAGEDLRFWGLTLVAHDLDALADRMGPLLGPVKDAVQPGRRIATLRRDAGSSAPLAFMTPR